MISLFDEEQIMKSFIKSERYEETKENARRLLKLGKIKIVSYKILNVTFTLS